MKQDGRVCEREQCKRQRPDAARQLQTHPSIATVAHAASKKKNGRKPPRRIGGEAAMRALRRASICSPRVIMQVLQRRQPRAAPPFVAQGKCPGTG